MIAKVESHERRERKEDGSFETITEEVPAFYFEVGDTLTDGFTGIRWTVTKRSPKTIVVSDGSRELRRKTRRMTWGVTDGFLVEFVESSGHAVTDGEVSLYALEELNLMRFDKGSGHFVTPGLTFEETREWLSRDAVTARYLS